MTVFIEYVIIDNMVFDCLILWAVNATLRLRQKWWRIVLGGAVGTGCAFATVFLQDFWGIIVKLLCLVTMCVVVCGFGKKLFWHILLCAAYTFILGGVIIGLFFLCGKDFLAGINIQYTDKVPIGLYALAVVIFCFLIYTIVKYIKTARHRQPFTKKINIVCKTFCQEAYGFFDSGNSLMYDGLPVCFAMKSLYKKISLCIADDIIKNKAICITLNTVGGKQNVFATKAQITLDNKCWEVYIALPKNASDVEYSVLLNAAMLEVKNEYEDFSKKSA